jgi:hypothetical protein
MPFALSGATIHADGRLQDGMAVLVTDGIIDGLAPELAIPEEY